MSPTFTRKLLAVHRWCSIVVSLNFLVLALTGLVLVFHEEIDAALGVVPKSAVLPDERRIDLSRAIAMAKQTKPDATALYVYRLDEAPSIVFVGLGEANERARVSRSVAVDVRGEGLILPKVDLDDTFTAVVLKLHAELLAGPAGRLVLGVVGLAIVAALVSGIVVYGPTMRRFFFGMLRRDKSRRTTLADLHKLLGAATFGWNLVVATTGALLCLSSLVLQLYASTEIAKQAAIYESAPVVTDLSTIEAAIDAAERAMPGRKWTTVALPGAALASPQHYSVFLRGAEGIEQHLFGLAMVDAAHPNRAVRMPEPWYIKTLLLSEPLHFGNYGGLPLKIVWATFTLITVVLTVAGVWMFFLGRRRKARNEHVAADRGTNGEVSLEVAS